MLQNRSVPDIQQKRTEWQQCLSEKYTGHLVFLDESSVNINMTRHYSRAQRNQRVVDSPPLNTPVNTTILSSIRLDGTCVYTSYQGGTTTERFQQYLEVNLLPTLGPDDILSWIICGHTMPAQQKIFWTKITSSICICHHTAPI